MHANIYGGVVLLTCEMHTQSKGQIYFAGTTDAIHTHDIESNCSDQEDAISSLWPLDGGVES